MLSRCQRPNKRLIEDRMVRHLKDRQFPITAIYDIDRAKATSIAAEVGCAASQDLSEVTAASDVVFTVVTDDKAVRQIFTGAGDNLLINARGKLFINCETISPGVEIDVEKLAHQAGAESLEACMASSITQARDGKLYLMCGGDEKTFRKAEPILKEIGSVVRYMGKSGQAAKVKALVNMPPLRWHRRRHAVHRRQVRPHQPAHGRGGELPGPGRIPGYPAVGTQSP